MSINAQTIIDLLTYQKDVALINAKQTLQAIGDDPDKALEVLNDQDGFTDIYKGLMSDNELEEAFDAFGQMPFTDRIGELEMDIWIQAANELGFQEVSKMLEDVKQNGV